MCVSRQVTLKGENTSQVVHDDQVKGLLRVRLLFSRVVRRRGDGQTDRCPRVQVGSTVEVKTNEGLSSEAVIGKLTDASLYTVGEWLPLGHMTLGFKGQEVSVCLFSVFDDGDEKTLRRTSLCLKGERHFAESEVSPASPPPKPLSAGGAALTGVLLLTDPGSAAAHQPGTLRNACDWQEEQPWRTPLLPGRVSVGGAAGPRRTQEEPPTLTLCFTRADEENESSSSEDEEDDRRRLSDELLGKVCSIETEEDPVRWYLALVGVGTSTCSGPSVAL